LDGDVSDWDVITFCQGKDEEQINRLEPLSIILFNTSAERKNPMGFNVSAG
jgi:hypothetical protein